MSVKRILFAFIAIAFFTSSYAQYEEDDEYWFLNDSEKENLEEQIEDTPTVNIDSRTYNKAEQEYNFIYIAHDATTPVQHLINRVRDVYDDAIRYNNAAVFYLSNGDKPVVIKVNMPGDNRADFDNQLVAELQEKNSHDIMADEDVRQILNIIRSNEIVDELGGLLYNSVTFDFYVNQNFWSLQNHEAVIAALYFTLRVRRFIEQEKEFYFNVYEYQNEKIEYENGKLFGEKDVDEINKNINLLPY